MSKITVTKLRDLINQYDNEEISISRFAEILNEHKSEWVSVENPLTERTHVMVWYRGEQIYCIYFPDGFYVVNPKGNRPVMLEGIELYYPLPPNPEK